MGSGSGSEVLKLMLDGITSIAISPDGKWIAGSGSHHDAIYIWNAHTGVETQRLRACGKQYDVTFFPDGIRIASRSHPNGRIHIWDAISGVQLSTARLVHFVSLAMFAVRSNFHAGYCLCSRLESCTPGIGPIYESSRSDAI